MKRPRSEGGFEGSESGGSRRVVIFYPPSRPLSRPFSISTASTVSNEKRVGPIRDMRDGIEGIEGSISHSSFLPHLLPNAVSRRCIGDLRLDLRVSITRSEPNSPPLQQTESQLPFNELQQNSCIEPVLSPQFRRTTSISPVPPHFATSRSSTPTPGRTLADGRAVQEIFDHVRSLFKGKFPIEFQGLTMPVKTKKFTEALAAFLLSASLNEGNPGKFQQHPVLIYCMFLRLAEMYETLRLQSTPLSSILQLIDRSFSTVFSGDPLRVWDRIMELVSEVQVQSDKLLQLGDFLFDSSKEFLIRGHMTALSSLCDQCRRSDGLKTLRTSFHSKISMMNPIHGIPFFEITSSITLQKFCEYFQSLGLGNLAPEYHAVFLACFNGDL